MVSTSFTALDSPERLRIVLAERGYYPDEAPADKLFGLQPDQIGMLRGAQIVALAGPAPDDNTLVVLYVPQDELPLEVLRRIRHRLEKTTCDGLVFCAKDWQKATLYLLRQEDIPQPSQESPTNDIPPRWRLNFNALRPADRQGLALLDLRDEDPYELGAALLRAFRRAQRETIYQNQGLFSNYYLLERLDTTNSQLDDDSDAQKAAWRSLAGTMDDLRVQIKSALAAGADSMDSGTTESKVIRPLLQALGWKTEKSNAGQLELRVDGDAVAFCHMLAYGAPLDLAPQSDDPFLQPPSPDLQLIGKLSGQKGVKWGILTNGRTWRLLSRQATSTSGVFYEIDLRDLLEIGAADNRDLRWFAAFFSKAWLHAPANQPGLLDMVYQSGQFWAEKLGNNLKVAIFTDVFVDFANALAEGERRAGREPDLPTVYRATLILLYRLLFVLYAESRRLLPLTSPEYYPHSLTAMLSSLALMQSGLLTQARDFSLQTDNDGLWKKLRALFTAIGEGRAEWKVPHYNGGLFADNTSAAHQFLASLDAVANDYLTKGLDQLARDEDARRARDENAALRLIDYMDLNVRRLGSIYEGLLEFQLRRADTHGEIIDGRLAPPTAKKNRRNSGRLVQENEVYLETTRQDRKASGSYYTPDYIVKYIVEQTVGPVLHERTKRFERHMDKIRSLYTSIRRSSTSATVQGLRAQLDTENEAAINALLDIKVLDPAMGSGHFLVEAVNYLSDQIIAILQDYPDNPLLPQLATVRKAMRANLKAQGIDGTVIRDEQLSDRVLLRRMVMKRCIYGVDLNEMAVDLAKLSLWLDSFAVGAPLSFLDHHLRWGNSLIGIWDVEHYIDTTSPRWTKFMNALGYMVQVTHLTDSTKAEVAESKLLYESAQAELQPFREQFNVDLAVHFAALGDVSQARRVAHTPHDERAAHAPETLTKFNTAQAEASTRRFFHWKLEFPEVFVDHEKRDWKAGGAAGFDAVVGNPPYIRESGNKSVFSYFQSSEHFRYHYQGKTDVYFYFMIQAVWLANCLGGVGFIVPANWLEAVSSIKLRSFLKEYIQLQSLVVFGGLQVFEDAAVEPLIIIANKRIMNEVFSYQYKTAKHTRAEDVILQPEVIATRIENLKSEGWHLKGANYQGIDETLERLLFVSDTINDFFHVEAGINTGADYVSNRSRAHWTIDVREGQGIFAVNREEIKQMQLSEKEATYIRKYIPAEHIDRYLQIDDNNHFLIYLNRDTDINSLPMIKSHLTRFKSILENRAEILRNPSREWWHLLWPRDHERYDKTKKLVIANATAHNNFYVDSQQIYYNIGCTILSPLRNALVSTSYAAAVLNSYLLDTWYKFRGQTQAETQRKYFPDKVRQIPIRRIHFTTPTDERTRLAGEVGALAAALLADERGLSLEHSAKGWPRYDAVVYRSTTLGQQVAALLPQDAAGNFVAFAEGASGAEEHSDVVHDLLAALAEQMIDLNKQKQAETKRFLSWLEAQLDITTDKDGRNGIDSLAGKTTLQQYLGDYQKNEATKTWDEVYAVLYKNRRRFVNDYWLSGMFMPQLKAAYEDSLARLQPLKTRLARTDALIDQIVYQLYGLTRDEIAVVEGS